MAGTGTAAALGTAATAAGTTAAVAAPVAATAATAGLTLSQMAALASLATTLTGLGLTAYDRANQPGVGGVPKPPPFNTTSPTTAGGEKLPPGVKANYAPLTPGGPAPAQFMANLGAGQSGDEMDVLQQIRASLGTNV